MRIAVAGPLGHVTDLVCRAVAAEATVVDLEAGGGHAAVVLVDPTAEEWRAARAARCPIVAVVGHDLSDEQVANSVLWGAEAVLHPREVVDRLEPVLRAVLAGETVLTGTEARALAVAARAAAGRARSSLSARERDIAELIVQGRTVKETALALGISAKTVENLQGRLFRKLGVRNRAQAAASLHALWAVSPVPYDDVGGFPS